MENNNQQYVYYQPSYSRVDPNYDAASKDFLTKAIVSCAIASLPIGSIIAIGMASRNLTALHEYLASGGLHTGKIKTSSAVSKVGKFGGIGFTIRAFVKAVPDHGSGFFLP